MNNYPLFLSEEDNPLVERFTGDYIRKRKQTIIQTKLTNLKKLKPSLQTNWKSPLEEDATYKHDTDNIKQKKVN